ncbi:unnamed protein product [Owenia fusiformis]|uniref:Uncharacterized protein n=1 Tax=Owenia fusiformis TaxID=6347 RepID=A0A8J1XJ16_OWEFU|nr:unnamed protein product [Owenia fusiformis]
MHQKMKPDRNSRVGNILNTDVDGSIYKLQYWQIMYENPFFNPNCHQIIKEQDVKEVLQYTPSSAIPTRSNKHSGTYLPVIPTTQETQCNNAVRYFESGEGRNIDTGRCLKVDTDSEHELATLRTKMKPPKIVVQKPSDVNFDRYSVTKLLRRPLSNAQMRSLDEKRSELYDDTDYKFRKFSFTTIAEEDQLGVDNFYKIYYPCLLEKNKRRHRIIESMTRLVNNRPLQCDSKFELSHYMLCGKTLGDIMNVDTTSAESLLEGNDEPHLTTNTRKRLANTILSNAKIKDDSEHPVDGDLNKDAIEEDIRMEYQSASGRRMNFAESSPQATLDARQIFQDDTSLVKTSNIVLETLHGGVKRGSLWAHADIEPELKEMQVNTDRKKYKYEKGNEDSDAEKALTALKFFGEILNRVHSEDELQQRIDSLSAIPKSALSSQSDVSLGHEWDSGSDVSIDDVTDYEHLLRFGEAVVDDDYSKVIASEVINKKGDVIDEVETNISYDHNENIESDRGNDGIEESPITFNRDEI